MATKRETQPGFWCPVCNQIIYSNAINMCCPYCGSEGFKTLREIRERGKE
ncbi:MAG: hypothetical protein ACOC1X_02095 [Promethearchaeota archaeon]